MGPSWKHILSFETDSMTRDEIVDATYEASLRLAKAKLEFGIIDVVSYRKLVSGVAASRQLVSEIDAIQALPDPSERQARLDAVRQRVTDLARPEVRTKDWLKWPIRRRFARLHRLARMLVVLFVVEIRQFLFKRLRLVFSH
jgi:hypothetical protein